MTYRSGRHFLQIPGPSNVPDRVQRAMHRAVLDHRSVEFSELGLDVLEGIKMLFKTSSPVLIYPSSGTGAWEAALTNTLSPGDKVLMAETGMFSTLWRNLAQRVGLDVEYLPGDWRRGPEPSAIEARLTEDKNRDIKAVCMVHNETSAGFTTRMAEIRKAIDASGHPALLMVDTISSLGSIDYRHDEWRADVSVGGSQKGLMLPPGLSFTAISDKAIEASKTSKLNCGYFNWNDMLTNNANGFFPYTPATTLLYGLQEALKMFSEEGMDNVFARHARLAEATRRAVSAWGLENQCDNPDEYSNSVTTVRMPEGRNADEFRKVVLENFDMSLGSGLGQLAGKVFRIGHLGDLNDLTLTGALTGVEMGLDLIGLHNAKGGIGAALDYLAKSKKAA